MAESMKELTLGRYLGNQRKLKRMTLRAVEEASDHDVSNAYLSQLEHDKIAKPSPNILYKLAAVYGISYETLMSKAGYLSNKTRQVQTKRHGRIATFAKEPLTQEEEEALLEYLAFLRSRRRGKDDKT